MKVQPSWIQYLSLGLPSHQNWPGDQETTWDLVGTQHIQIMTIENKIQPGFLFFLFKPCHRERDLRTHFTKHYSSCVFLERMFGCLFVVYHVQTCKNRSKIKEGTENGALQNVYIFHNRCPIIFVVHFSIHGFSLTELNSSWSTNRFWRENKQELIEKPSKKLYWELNIPIPEMSQR